MKKITASELKKLSAPNLKEHILGVAEEITNGFGESVDLRQVVRDFNDALVQVIAAVKKGRPLPETFFVPDLWHVTNGDGKTATMPTVKKPLWDAAVLGMRLGDTYYGGTSERTQSLNYPGTNFVQR